MKGSLPKLVLIVVLAVGMSGCTQAFENLQNPAGPRGPGSNYEAYLTGQRKLVVELDHSPGAKWDTSTNVDEDFRKQLQRITSKNVEIRYTAELPSRGQDYAWSASELRDLHDEYQDLSSDDSKVVMHALLVDGDFENRNTLGLSYAAEAFALFQGRISDVSCSNDAALCPSGETRMWKVNRAVGIHEAGHLFGLVGNPLPMVEDHKMREDPNPDTPENEAGNSHSSNEGSVMYYAVDTRRGVANVFGDSAPPHTFDRNDMRDAQAQRSGGSS